ncbi:agmatinase [candidate division KSB1 bacterium]|nr:agmatinase [candidate division KSB1 bacterium]
MPSALSDMAKIKVPNNFLGLEPNLSNYANARAAILPLPYEATTSYGAGTKRGPKAIIKASQQVEFFDEELNVEPCEVGVATVNPLAFGKLSGASAVKKIAGSCRKLISDGKFVLGLGGEHTVTVGMVQAMHERYPDLWVVQLDAHSDLRDEYAGSPYSHACAMARVVEFCPLVGLGIRSGIAGERERLKPPSQVYYGHEMRQMGAARWMEQVFKLVGPRVYLTIDVDFFNPAEMPAVGTPEPGGFGWYETLDFLRELFSRQEVVGGDIVELMPLRGMPAADFLAARLAYKLIAYKFFARKRA